MSQQAILSPTAAPHPSARSWACVNLDSVRHNLRTAHEITSKPVMAIVKADAYGHGMERIAAALADEKGCAFFGVAQVSEARRLAKLKVKQPILLLGPCFEAEQTEVVEQGWIAVVSSLEEAKQFSNVAQALGKRATVHIALDTGMGRCGFLPDQLSPSDVETLLALPSVHMAGIFSHLPCADEDEEFTKAELRLFDSIAGPLADKMQACAPAGAGPITLHVLNSAGVLAYSEVTKCSTLVRSGLMLYGVSPVPRFQHKLRAVMSVHSHVTLVRELPAGQGISYGRAVVLEKPTTVATVGIGYGDGYLRSLSLRGAEVWIQGSRCAVLGRITMDQILVDVTHLEQCASGDEVECFGPHIPVAEVATKAETIPWEIFTSVTARVDRKYITGNPLEWDAQQAKGKSSN